MAPVPSRSRRLLVAAAAVAALAASAVVAAPAFASGSHHPAHHPAHHRVHPVRPGSSYLALGDSVSFGYREPANLPTPDYPDASTFVGFPENVGSALGLRVANASCPGETSGSLVSASELSYACRLTPTGTDGYRTKFPLHVGYAGTQLQYARSFLARHRNTDLVTLMIGANDGFLCQATTTDQCASELPGVLAKISANVRTILGTLRQQEHYRGQIVIVNYYSTDYRSAVQNGSSQALNTAMDTAAKPFDVTVADGYATFQKAAAQAGGDTCAAGLLTTLTTGGCGVHPSVGGQALLALAVEKAIRR
ncbi:SGNH/GDSL hydrolase family protein [uncultured Jatrophihabitans sp.]|uniref:SGNH/GDSL hydrolase family protein n=1 Tax=uncultured Jatrophihabitans sp. TaxID=1610747 RepID=UPI0035CB03EB